MGSFAGSSSVLVPMKLDAFVLNPAVCAGSANDNDDEKLGARIAPITQPNYTFLRLDNFLIQSDVQNHVDLHNTAPASVNPRMTDLGARPRRKPLRHRHGVYLHWTLPRFYRAGLSSATAVAGTSNNESVESEPHSSGGEGSDEGEAGGQNPKKSNLTPAPVAPPTRWLVIRKIDVDTILPEAARKEFQSKEYQAWVIESDHLWSLDSIPNGMDLQTDMAPFIVGQQGLEVDIEEQAEVFIGRKTPLESWSGREDPAATPPNIGLLQSSNQLFADFQMHNSNVFSMVDNFPYGSEVAPQYLTKAKASYYVLGWHWKEEVDPIWNSGASSNHGESLDTLFMTMQGLNSDPKIPDPWLTESSQLRIMCHGAMYEVNWDYDTKPKEVPADNFNKLVRDQTAPSFSVGTTPMDAIISYCTARKGKGKDPDLIAKLEEDILALDSLLHARDDGVEGQREAKDTIYNWAFARSPGGMHYHFSADGRDQPDGKPLEPDSEAAEQLAKLNQAQGLLESCNRMLQQKHWDMFSLWWKYVSDVSNKDRNIGQNQKFKADSESLANIITALQKQLDFLKAVIKKLLPDSETPWAAEDPPNLLAGAKSGTRPFFYRAHDPTVLVGGVESGWPVDYLDKLAVRVPSQTVNQEGGSGLPQLLTDLLALVVHKLPGIFQSAIEALIPEFFVLRPDGNDPGTPKGGKYYPLYHDKKGVGRWRDQWGDRQPWFPVYAEWEVEYTHVPFENWSLDEHTARLSANKLVRYGITVPSQKPLWEELPPVTSKARDARILSGRVLILPQPSFSLQAKVAQLFQDTPPAVLDPILSPEERENLLDNIGMLSYLSSPLSGLTNGLLTLSQGSHIKPENKTFGAEGESLAVIDAAVFDDAGLEKDRIGLIDGNSALTPYASVMSFLDSPNCPFKPVTHGQFRFRKFNIIDKFGQSLTAIDPTPRVDGPPPMYPCISDFYEPQTINIDGEQYANTVIQNNADHCEFVQLPPQINQNVRLNACFVKRLPVGSGSSTSKWRPASEWENPIWGWVIINYADYGIQLFLPDGTFYREVRIGGPTGALAAPKWIPFQPDSNIDPSRPADSAQLDELVKKLLQPDYLRAFWGMITMAQDNLAPAPSAYAQYLNAIVGKPLALVNMGWSLELDGPALQNQSTKAGQTDPELPLENYSFQVKLGDKESEYDGLVGYFDTVTQGSETLNLNYINTFFVSGDPVSANQSLRKLDTTTYPKFSPFWQAPFPSSPPFDKPIDAATFDDRRNSRMSVFGAIVDPFTPVHGYSSILPPVSLSLGPWTWQSAMNTMTAFFHAGPLTIATNDVPAFDRSQLLTDKKVRDTPARNLALPSLGADEWSWLQPYVDDSVALSDLDAPPVFNAFGIEGKGDLNKPGFEKGPYVAIEGFLQLRKPVLTVTDPKKGA